MKPLIALVVPFLALTGCAALDQAAKDLQKASAPAQRSTVPEQKATTTVMTSDSISQICKAIQNNDVMGNELYKNKGLSLSGEVLSIGEHYDPRYWVLMRSGKTTIHARTNNKQAIAHLQTGKTTRVSGVISNVTVNWDGCSITLENSTF